MALGWVVLILVLLSHISWFGENCCDVEEGPFCFITSVATWREANTSLRICSRAQSLSSTAGRFDAKLMGGWNWG